MTHGPYPFNLIQADPNDSDLADKIWVLVNSLLYGLAVTANPVYNFPWVSREPQLG